MATSGEWHIIDGKWQRGGGTTTTAAATTNNTEKKDVQDDSNQTVSGVAAKAALFENGGLPKGVVERKGSNTSTGSTDSAARSIAINSTRRRSKSGSGGRVVKAPSSVNKLVSTESTKSEISSSKETSKDKQGTKISLKTEKGNCAKTGDDNSAPPIVVIATNPPAPGKQSPQQVAKQKAKRKKAANPHAGLDKSHAPPPGKPGKSRPPAPNATRKSVPVPSRKPPPSKPKRPQSVSMPSRPPPPKSHETATAAEAYVLFKAKWKFQSRHPDELELEYQDVVRDITHGSLKKPDPGWIFGENLRTRKVGLVPKNYLEESSGAVTAPPPPAPPPPPSLPIPPVQQPSIVPRSSTVPPPPPPQLQHSQYTISQGEPAPPPPPPPPMAASSSGINHSRSHNAAELNRGSSAGYFGMPVTKRNGYCTDVIGILSSNKNQVFATNFNVRFTGRSAKNSSKGDTVDVLVDGQIRFTMVIKDGGTCTFRDGKFQCDSNILGSIKTLQTLGPHQLRFEHRFNYNGDYRLDYIEGFLWIWDYSQSVLVSDVDGTITKSDVGGMINGVLGARLGWKKGHAHSGVVKLYNELVERVSDCMVLYLTARPLNMINDTRSYIYELEQSSSNKRLPSGAIISDTTNYSSSFRREVIDKSSHVFKIQMLSQLRDCFKHAGRDIRRYPVFLATFGNKETDVKAYLAAGVADEFRLQMNSYSDPRLLSLLLERIELIKSGKLPDPNLPID